MLEIAIGVKNKKGEIRRPSLIETITDPSYRESMALDRVQHVVLRLS
jgi:hypothetical protein